LCDTVPAERFDMRTWVSRGVGPDDPLYVGCAAGWATKIFASEGFSLARVQSGSHFITVQFEGLFGLDATRKFFGLDEDENRYLFAAGGDPDISPLMESERIRQVIRRRSRAAVALSSLPGRVFDDAFARARNPERARPGVDDLRVERMVSASSY
jgi:hypothetical protein